MHQKLHRASIQSDSRVTYTTSKEVEEMKNALRRHTRLHRASIDAMNTRIRNDTIEIDQKYGRQRYSTTIGDPYDVMSFSKNPPSKDPSFTDLPQETATSTQAGIIFTQHKHRKSHHKS